MVYYLTKARYRGGYRFFLEFETGEEGIVDLEADKLRPVRAHEIPHVRELALR